LSFKYLPGIVELTMHRFGEVDAAFPYDEAEGNQTLAFWR